MKLLLHHELWGAIGINTNPHQSTPTCKAKVIITNSSFLEVRHYHSEFISPETTSWLPRLQSTSQHLVHAWVCLSICASVCELQQSLIMKLKVKTVITDVNTKRSSSPSLSVSNTFKQELIVSLQSSQVDCQRVTPSRVETTDPCSPPMTCLFFVPPNVFSSLLSLLSPSSCPCSDYWFPFSSCCPSVPPSVDKHRGDLRFPSLLSFSNCQSVPPSTDKGKVSWWLICWANTSFFKYNPLLFSTPFKHASRTSSLHTHFVPQRLLSLLTCEIFFEFLSPVCLPSHFLFIRSGYGFVTISPFAFIYPLSFNFFLHSSFTSFFIYPPPPRFVCSICLRSQQMKGCWV